MGAIKEQCGGCYFFRGHREDDVLTGQCFRRPPHAVHGCPGVRPDHWCGEFQRARCRASFYGTGSMLAECALDMGHDGDHVAVEEVTSRVWSDSGVEAGPETVSRTGWPLVVVHSRRCKCKGTGLVAGSPCLCADPTVSPVVVMTLGQWLQVGRPSDTENALLALHWAFCPGCGETRPVGEIQERRGERGADRVSVCHQCAASGLFGEA